MCGWGDGRKLEDRGVLPKEENISGKREWLRLSSVMRMEKCVGFGGMRVEVRKWDLQGA